MLVNTLTSKMLTIDEILIINKRDNFTPQYWSWLEYWRCMKCHNFVENCQEIGVLNIGFRHPDISFD